MDLDSVRRSLEKKKKTIESDGSVKSTLGDDHEKSLDSGLVDSLPHRFFEPFIMQGMNLDLVEPGRLLCSFSVPPRLVSEDGNAMHEGAIATLVDWVGASVVYTLGAVTTGVSVEINVSFFDTAFVGEEIEVEAKALRVGKRVAVVTVELRKNKTGNLIAHGRHSMYMAFASKL